MIRHPDVAGSQACLLWLKRKRYSSFLNAGKCDPLTQAAPRHTILGCCSCKMKRWTQLEYKFFIDTDTIVNLLAEGGAMGVVKRIACCLIKYLKAGALTRFGVASPALLLIFFTIPLKTLPIVVPSCDMALFDFLPFGSVMATSMCFLLAAEAKRSQLARSISG
jgi:hypothetical protein